MKIALVKQNIYQDLYVCGNRTSPEEILSSTLMRIGPIGLFTLFDSDFFIIKEQKDRECQTWKRSFNPGKELMTQLKTRRACDLDVREFKYLKPRSTHSHADFAIDPQDIDWSLYDVVISINTAIPARITKRHPSTLWCHMIGEANAFTEYPVKGYDVSITQNVTGEVASGLGKVDFPYTFMGPNFLNTIATTLFGPVTKTGVYAEINTTTTRPVRNVPQLEFVKDLGHELILHHQDILENIKNLHRSKYFLKLGGRKIRGNSIIEAISCGSLVLMDPKDVTHSQLLPKELWVHNQEEAQTLIKRLDTDTSFYEECKRKQQELLSFFVVDTPMESLHNCLEAKRAGNQAPRKTFKDKNKQNHQIKKTSKRKPNKLSS